MRIVSWRDREVKGNREGEGGSIKGVLIHIIDIYFKFYILYIISTLNSIF